MHTAEVSTLLQQLDLLNAQLATHKHAHVSCSQHAQLEANQAVAAATKQQEQSHKQEVVQLMAQCKQQKSQINSLQLELRTATSVHGLVRPFCSSDAGSGADTDAMPQREAHGTISCSSSRLAAQHSKWMRQLPELLHWKRAGFVLVRAALQKWAAVTVAEKRHSRYCMSAQLCLRKLF